MIWSFSKIRIEIDSFSQKVGMETTIDKCAMLATRRWQVVNSEVIQLPDGQNLKSIEMKRE